MTHRTTRFIMAGAKQMPYRQAQKCISRTSREGALQGFPHSALSVAQNRNTGNREEGKGRRRREGKCRTFSGRPSLLRSLSLSLSLCLFVIPIILPAFIQYRQESDLDALSLVDALFFTFCFSFCLYLEIPSTSGGGAETPSSLSSTALCILSRPVHGYTQNAPKAPDQNGRMVVAR